MVSSELARILGPAVRRAQVATDEDVIALVRRGLPYASLEHLAGALEMSVGEVAATLAVPRSTVSRRKKAGQLAPDESEKVIRLARTVLRAEEVLGSREKAFRWLASANRALGGHRPLDLLDVELGAQKVDEVLGRIAYGVYS